MLWGKPMLNFSFPSYTWQCLMPCKQNGRVLSTRQTWKCEETLDIINMYIIIIISISTWYNFQFFKCREVDANFRRLRIYMQAFPKHRCDSKKQTLICCLWVGKIANGRDGWCDWPTCFLEKAMQACVRHQHPLASNAGELAYTPNFIGTNTLLFDNAVLLTGAL